MKHRRWSLAFTLCVFCLWGCGKDKATNPGDPPGNPPPGGSNGKIAFVSRRDATAGVNDDDVYIMNPDGSNVRRLTDLQADLDYTCISPDGSWIAFNNVSAGEVDLVRSDATGLVGITQGKNPSWSPDGIRIALDRVVGSTSQVFIMNADGSGASQVTTGGGQAPAWSPNGTRIAYLRGAIGFGHEISFINPDGTGASAVSDTVHSSSRLDWRPDGSLLVFVRMIPDPSAIYTYALCTIGPDGRGLAQIPGIPNAWQVRQPSWSPDGTSITFARYVSGSYDVYVVKADGTGLTNISNAGGVDSGPDWGP